VTILISDQLLTKISQKKQKSLHIENGNNSSRRYNNYKHILTKCGNTQFHKIKSIKHKSTGGTESKNSAWFMYHIPQKGYSWKMNRETSELNDSK
jgi:hypothetical protein